MLVVNLFGAPGAGKTTLAFLLAGALKTHYPDLTTECPDEIPKYIVYDEAPKAFGCQLYIAGKQQWQISRCAGHADIVICDSPILLSPVYAADNGQNLPDAFREVCVHYHNLYPSLNFFVERAHRFEAKARIHGEDDETRLQAAILGILDSSKVTTFKVRSDINTAFSMARTAATKAYELRKKNERRN